MIKTVLLLIYTLVLLIMIILLANNNQDFLKQNDAYEFAQIGNNIIKNAEISYNNRPDVIQPPGFPLIIGLINTCLNDLKWSGQLISIASYVISIFIFFQILRWIKPEITYISVILYSSNSTILFNSINGYSDSSFVLFFLLLILVFIMKMNYQLSSITFTLLFIVLWLSIYYTKPEGFIIGIILFIWLIIYRLITSRIVLILIPILVLILMLPYMYFLYEHTGKWQLSGKLYANLVLGELESPYQHYDKKVFTDSRYDIISKTHLDPKLSKGVIAYFRETGFKFFERIPHNFYEGLKYLWHSFSFIGIILFVMGVVQMNKKYRLFLLSLLLPFLSFIMFFITSRNAANFYWIWCVFIASGIMQIQYYFSHELCSKVLRRLFCFIVFFLFLYNSRSVILTVYKIIIT